MSFAGFVSKIGKIMVLKLVGTMLVIFMKILKKLIRILYLESKSFKIAKMNCKDTCFILRDLETIRSQEISAKNK